MRRRRYVAGLLLLAACVLGAALLLRSGPRETAETKVQSGLKEPESRPPESKPALQPEAAEPSPYKSPIDFPALWEMNPDIYAWLQIPGTDVSYPLLQRAEDDSFYLDHNSQGEADKNGSLYTEGRYNATDFSAPVTVVYGHHMRSGAMFGRLQADYSSMEGLEAYGEIVVYLPEEELHFQVFAGVPFSNTHLLYHYDFSDQGIYQAFLDHIRTFRAIDAHVKEDLAPVPGDQMLVLSTCLQGNNKRRYLVLAKRIDDRSPTQNTKN